MRFVLILLLALLVPSSVTAANSFKIPFSIVPGSVQVAVANNPAQTPDLPFSVFGINGSCYGTLSAEVVNGGIEVSFEGTVVPACTAPASFYFQVEMVVPELGGTATVVRVDARDNGSSFSTINSAVVQWRPEPLISTSLSGALASPGELSVSWFPNDLVLYGTVSPLASWIPGDTVRMPVTVVFDLTPTTVGTAKVRYEFLVSVPEPSASLSLPLGMAWLAGLSVLRGGA